MRKFLIRFIAPLFFVATLVGCTTAHSEIREENGIKYICSWTETPGAGVDSGSMRCYPADGPVYP